MPEDRRASDRPEPSPAERRIARSLIDEGRRMGAIPMSELQRERTVEAYLRAGVMPRWMERLREIHAGTERHRRELAAAYDELREACGDDRAAFAGAWRARVEAWPFGELNELIRTHNEWFPVERQLPVDPRTGEYVLIAGRPYWREELTPAWALAQFPATSP